MATIEKSQERVPDTEAAFSKAVTKASDLLGLKQTEFAEIVGITPAQASRLWNKTYFLSDSKKSEWERALLFYRSYRSLVTLISDKEMASVWLRNHNLGLGGTPIELMKSVEGLVDVVRYLDASRGNV